MAFFASAIRTTQPRFAGTRRKVSSPMYTDAEAGSVQKLRVSIAGLSARTIWCVPAATLEKENRPSEVVVVVVGVVWGCCLRSG